VFRERYPEVRWCLREMTPVAQMLALKEKRIDLCVFRVGYDDPGVRNELLMYEPIRAVLPAIHPLAQQERIAPTDLADEPFVALELNQSRFANFLFQCCVQAGFTPQIRQQAIEVQTLLSLVQANFGVTLLPASLEQMAPAGVVFRSLTPSLPEVPLYAVYRAADDSAVLKLFLDTLRELVAVESQRVTG
jgi:DNA-binding transcriptional LysR family regulator